MNLSSFQKLKTKVKIRNGLRFTNKSIKLPDAADSFFIRPDFRQKENLPPKAGSGLMTWTMPMHGSDIRKHRLSGKTMYSPGGNQHCRCDSRDDRCCA